MARWRCLAEIFEMDRTGIYSAAGMAEALLPQLVREADLLSAVWNPRMVENFEAASTLARQADTGPDGKPAADRLFVPPDVRRREREGEKAVCWPPRCSPRSSSRRASCGPFWMP
jgi:hypothetical protein